MERILTLSHGNGEYVAVNVSGPTTTRHEMRRVLRDANAYLQRPSTTKNVALQLTDAVFGREDCAEIVDWVRGAEANLFRLAIVGATRHQHRLLKKGIRKLSDNFNSHFFDDWEAAKDWLIGRAR